MSRKISIPAFDINVKLENTDILNKLIDKGLETREINKNCKIVELNANNSNTIEKEIKYDANFIDFGKIAYENEIYKCKTIDKINIRGWLTILRGIDITNSTNVWRYGGPGKKSMENIAKFLGEKHGYKKILNHDKNLVNEIIKNGKSSEVNKDYRSFTSKVCKYIDEYANLNNNNDNFYFVDDYYIRRMLPYYYYAYTKKEEITINNKQVSIYKSSTKILRDMSYDELYCCLDEIRKNANSNITRNQMDHIIWYSYKSFER